MLHKIMERGHSKICDTFSTLFRPPPPEVFQFYIIKVLVQPGLGSNGRNFGRNLNHQTSYLLLYKCEVAKLGSKAGNSLYGKRGGGARGKEIQREREIDKDRERKSKT